MEDNLQKRLVFHMSGEYFENERYDLKKLLKGLEAVEALLEKTYVHISGKERFTDSDEKNFKITISDVRPGSFKATLDIIMNSVVLPLFPLLTAQEPKDIWNLLKESYGYLKVILSAKKEGKTVELKNDGNGNTNVIVSGNNNVITVNEIVPDLSRKLSSTFGELNKVANSAGVNSIEFGDQENGDSILLNNATKDIFEKRTILESKIYEFEGSIYSIDTFKYKGKLRVTSGNKQIPNGDYKFVFIDGDEVSIQKIRESLRSSKKFKCLRRIQFNPDNLKETIVELKIIEIYEDMAA